MTKGELITGCLAVIIAYSLIWISYTIHITNFI